MASLCLLGLGPAPEACVGCTGASDRQVQLEAVQLASCHVVHFQLTEPWLHRVSRTFSACCAIFAISLGSLILRRNNHLIVDRPRMLFENVGQLVKVR